MEHSEKHKCLLCEKTAKLITSKQKGYLKPDIYSIYYCPGCNTSFSIPRVDATSIYNLIYNKGKEVPGYDRYWRYAKEILLQKDPFQWLANEEPVYWGVYDTIINRLKARKDIRILELGSGLGYLTYALKMAGFCNTVGWDISEEAVEKAKEKFGEYYECQDLYKAPEKYHSSFDLVILTEVIEHIENPSDFLAAILRLVKPNGNIVLTTPNKSFYPKNAIWVTDLPPVHCWWFSEDSFKFLAKRMNFKLQFVDYTPFYRTHVKLLFDTKESEALSEDFIFDQSGKLIENNERSKNKGLFPLWVKKTTAYKRISRKVWPLLSKRFIVSGERTNSQCVVITK